MPGDVLRVHKYMFRELTPFVVCQLLILSAIATAGNWHFSLHERIVNEFVNESSNLREHEMPRAESARAYYA